MSLARKSALAPNPVDTLASGMTSLSLNTSTATKPNPADPIYLQQAGLWYLVSSLHRCFMQTVTAYRHLGMVREALNYAEESLKVARAVDSTPLIAYTLIVIGDLQIRSGRLDEGEKNLIEAKELGVSGRYEVALELALGNLAKRRGQHEEEVEAYRRALQVLTELVDSMSKAGGAVDDANALAEQYVPTCVSLVLATNES